MSKFSKMKLKQLRVEMKKRHLPFTKKDEAGKLRMALTAYDAALKTRPKKPAKRTTPRTNKPRKISVPTSRAASLEEIREMIREERAATPKKPKSKSKKRTNVARQTKQNQPKPSALDELIHGMTHPFGD